MYSLGACGYMYIRQGRSGKTGMIISHHRRRYGMYMYVYVYVYMYLSKVGYVRMYIQVYSILFYSNLVQNHAGSLEDVIHLFSFLFFFFPSFSFSFPFPFPFFLSSFSFLFFSFRKSHIRRTHGSPNQRPDQDQVAIVFPTPTYITHTCIETLRMFLDRFVSFLWSARGWPTMEVGSLLCPWLRVPDFPHGGFFGRALARVSSAVTNSVGSPAVKSVDVDVNVAVDVECTYLPTCMRRTYWSHGGSLADR